MEWHQAGVRTWKCPVFRLWTAAAVAAGGVALTGCGKEEAGQSKPDRPAPERPAVVTSTQTASAHFTPEQAIAQLPALAPIAAAGDPADQVFRQTGAKRKMSERPWGRGGKVQTYAVEVETRGSATAAWSKAEAIVEFTVDGRGEVVTSRTLAIKGPDELELERASEP